MTNISKFLENELDRVNTILAQAQGNLIIPMEMCENRCSDVTPVLSEIDEKVIDFLNEELFKINSKIIRAQELILGFKKYYYNLQLNDKNNK